MSNALTPERIAELRDGLRRLVEYHGEHARGASFEMHARMQTTAAVASDALDRVAKLETENAELNKRLSRVLADNAARERCAAEDAREAYLYGGGGHG